MKGVLGMTSSRVPGTRPGRPICGLPEVTVRCYARCEAQPLARRTNCPVRCRPEANSSLRLPVVTTGYSCRRALRRRPLLLAAPGADPLFDLLMRNPLAAIERSHGFLNAGDLPLVQVEVFVYRLSGEGRSAPPGTLGQFLQSLLDDRINADADGCR